MCYIHKSSPFKDIVQFRNQNFQDKQIKMLVLVQENENELNCS